MDAMGKGGVFDPLGLGGGGGGAAASGMDEDDDLGISFDSPGGAPGGSTGLTGGLTTLGPGFASSKPPAAPATSIGDEMDALFDGPADIPKEKKKSKKSKKSSK